MPPILLHIHSPTALTHPLSVRQHICLSQLREVIANSFNISIKQFDLYHQNALLQISQDPLSLQQLGIGNESIVNVVQKQQNRIQIKIEYGMEYTDVRVQSDMPLGQFKENVGKMIGVAVGLFDLIVGDQVAEGDQLKLGDFGLKNGQIISVKRKIPTEGGLGNKIKMAESILSCSDPADQNTNTQEPSLRIQKQIHKKASCSASLHNINEHSEIKHTSMKTSSIEPYNSNKQNVKQSRQNKLTRIQDIKETMSFGSLQQAKSQQTELQIWNEDKTILYKFSCPFECKVAAVRAKLAKILRVSLQNLQILESKDEDLVQNLSQTGDTIPFVYKVNDNNQ